MMNVNVTRRFSHNGDSNMAGWCEGRMWRRSPNVRVDRLMSFLSRFKLMSIGCLRQQRISSQQLKDSIAWSQFYGKYLTTRWLRSTLINCSSIVDSSTVAFLRSLMSECSRTRWVLKTDLILRLGPNDLGLGVSRRMTRHGIDRNSIYWPIRPVFQSVLVFLKQTLEKSSLNWFTATA